MQSCWQSKPPCDSTSPTDRSDRVSLFCADRAGRGCDLIKTQTAIEDLGWQVSSTSQQFYKRQLLAEVLSLGNDTGKWNESSRGLYLTEGSKGSLMILYCLKQLSFARTVEDRHRQSKGKGAANFFCL